jgi:hypothetical protein
MAKHSVDPREWPSCPFWLEPWVPGEGALISHAPRIINEDFLQQRGQFL